MIRCLALYSSSISGLLAALAVGCSSATPSSSSGGAGAGVGASVGADAGTGAGTGVGAGAGGSGGGSSGVAIGGSSGAGASASSGAEVADAGDGGAADAGPADAADGGGSVGAADGGVNMVPAGYAGTPFKPLTIPGTIYAADYDRGGPTVAFCRSGTSCTDGIVTGDWAPSNTPPYRPPLPATAKICSGAACADNVGLCRINPEKPDNTLAGQPVMPIDTYVCYSTAGEWLKYTVAVTEAGTYSVGGFMAVPMGGGVNLSFGGGITTGDVALPISPTTNCGCGENYHSWAERDDLATVTFPVAGTYLMTMTQVGRFNADRFTFTKM
jgi:hypothetical protein